MADKQSRKWQLTINNPQDKGLDHESIKQVLGQFKSCTYYCMSDEIGLDEQTPHTHIFITLRSPAKFGLVKKRFPEAHIEAARGTVTENRAYVEKSGKWANDPKSDTSIPGTFEESGPPPEEPGQGARSDIAEIYRQIEEGMSNAEIMAANPDSAKYISLMDRVRQEVLADRFKNQWRDLTVTYIFGKTGSGKTRSVMEKYGYENVFRATNYQNPFDTYKGQDVIIFEEFRSSLPISDMLKYLDGYPVMLPCRYADKVACYTQVFLISNIPLDAQYFNVQHEEKESWCALLRRIGKVIEYRANGPPIDHGPALDYIFPPPPPVPDWVREAEQVEQSELPF